MKQYPFRTALALLAGTSIQVALVAQTAWFQRPLGTDPTPRAYHAMTYDSANGEVVLFGGDPGTGIHLGDTWGWDGTRWTQHAPPTSPDPRYGAQMAHDPARGVSTLFGGVGASIHDDTWEWDGSTWTQHDPSPHPAARIDHAMTYDAARAHVVMFGGTVAAGVAVDDTWTWDGGTWQLHTPTQSPSPRVGAALCYDPERQVCLLFGGIEASTTFKNDTWQWDGTSWTQLTPPVSPTPLAAAKMVYDPTRDRVILSGGIGSATAETWEWDGSTWILRSQGPAPGIRYAHGMAFHHGIGRAIVFGGFDALLGATLLNDTWEYHHFTPASYLPFGQGCPGSAGIPILDALDNDRPWIDETFDLVLAPLGVSPPSTPFLLLGASDQLMLGGVPLPLDLGLIGMTGCSLFVSTELSIPLLNQGGVASVSIPVPNDMRFVGESVFVQGFVLDAGSPGGAVVSDAGRLIIGAK